MPRKTKEEAQKTRQRIMKSAELVFYERGVVSTSLQEVAEAAGVTRGAVYWHFKDKLELLRALADATFMPHEAFLDQLAATDHADPLGALRTACLETFETVTGDASRRRLFTIFTKRCEYIDEMSSLTQRNQACRLRALERLTALLEQAQRKKKLATCWTPAAAAVALQHMFMGFIMTEMEWARPSAARTRTRTEAIEAFFKALSA